MKRLRRILGICLLLFLLFPISIHADNMDGGNTPSGGNSSSETTEKDDTETASFISDAIKSLDEKIAEKEVSRNYIKNFYNSSVTVKTKGFNLLDLDSLAMGFLNLITTLLEMIGIAFTFFIMLLYNLISSSFMETVLNEVLDVVDKLIFDWNNPNSWIMKVLLITTLFSILYQLIKNFTRMNSWKNIVQLVVTSFISMTFIIFIGQHGRSIVNGLEKSVNTMMAQTFVYGDEKDPEIANKENIFDILQVQPFMVRHYGTTSYEAIAKSSDHDKVNKAKERVQKLLDEPSERNAEKEYDEYGNKIITHNTGSSAQVLFLSIIMLIHRVGIGIVLGVCCLALGAVKVAKTILLGLSVYQLIWWLLKRTGKARQWFLDRLMWSMVAVITNVIFNAALFFLVTVCTKVAENNVLFMLAFDAILILILWLAMKNIGSFTARMKNDGGMVVEAMLKGNSSPMDTFKNLKNSHRNETGLDDETMDTSKLGNDDTYDDNLQDSGIKPYESNDEGLADHHMQDLDNILDDIDSPVPGSDELDEMQQDSENSKDKSSSTEEIELETAREKDDASDDTEDKPDSKTSEENTGENGSTESSDDSNETEDANTLVLDSDHEKELQEDVENLEDDGRGKLSQLDDEEDLSDEADELHSEKLDEPSIEGDKPDSEIIDVQDNIELREEVEVEEEKPFAESNKNDNDLPNENAMEEQENGLDERNESTEKEKNVEQEDSPIDEQKTDDIPAPLKEDNQASRVNDSISEEIDNLVIEDIWDEED